MHRLIYFGRAIFLVIIPILVGGCASTFPTDLAFSSIQVVNYKERPELGGPPKQDSVEPSRPYLDYLLKLQREKKGEFIKPSDLDYFFEKFKTSWGLQEGRPSNLLLKIEFTSKENLFGYIKKNNYNLFSSTHFCSSPNDPWLRHFRLPHVYWDGLNLSYSLNYSILNSDQESYTYYVFYSVHINTENGRKVYSYGEDITSYYQSFDLRDKPQSVCLQIWSGEDGSRGNKSNSVMIPREIITQALNEYEKMNESVKGGQVKPPHINQTKD